MENNNNNIFLGKIEKSGCYVNNGKYGHFLTCGKKNYKIPEWLEPEEIKQDTPIKPKRTNKKKVVENITLKL